MFVLGAGNACDFAYRSKYAGDHAPEQTVIEAALGIKLSTDKCPFVYPSTQKWAKALDVAHKISLPKIQWNIRMLKRSKLLRVASCVLCALLAIALKRARTLR